MLEQRLDLRREQEMSVRQQRVMQRLDAQAVAGKEQRLPIAVPQREREHAAEAVHAAFAPGFPGVHDHLGVAARVEAVTERLQLRYQRLVVVDLAVVDDDDRAVLVVERLLAGREVDDRQPAMAERDPRLEVQTVAVGSAMGDRLVHTQRQAAVRLPLESRIDDACDPAHLSALRRPSDRRVRRRTARTVLSSLPG